MKSMNEKGIACIELKIPSHDNYLERIEDFI